MCLIFFVAGACKALHQRGEKEGLRFLYLPFILLEMYISTFFRYFHFCNPIYAELRAYPFITHISIAFDFFTIILSDN